MHLTFGKPTVVKAVLILVHFEPKQHLSWCTRDSLVKLRGTALTQTRRQSQCNCIVRAESSVTPVPLGHCFPLRPPRLSSGVCCRNLHAWTTAPNRTSSSVSTELKISPFPENYRSTSSTHTENVLWFMSRIVEWPCSLQLCVLGILIIT